MRLGYSAGWGFGGGSDEKIRRMRLGYSTGRGFGGGSDEKKEENEARIKYRSGFWMWLG